MSTLLRLVLVMALAWVGRGLYRAWKADTARERERERAARTGRFDNPSDQEVSDADFEDIP